MKVSELKVLLVDDDEFISQIVSKFVKKIGVKHIFLTNNGYDAVAIAVREQPDIVLLDLVMPDLGGLKILKMLKTIHITRNSHVIVITASEDIENVAKAVRLGAKDYVLKASFQDFIMNKLLSLIPSIEKEEVFVQIL